MAWLLHQAVGLFARHTGFGQIEQKLAGEDEAAGALQVLEHAPRINQKLLDQRSGLGQQVVGQDGGVGKDDALDRRVGDVPLVPQRHILESGLSIARG